MKILIGFLISYCFSSWIFSTAYAQTDMEGDLSELINLQAIELNNNKADNISVIEQIGIQQNITISQNNKGTSSNLIFAKQLGNNNNAVIHQYGSGLQTLLTQNGGSNYANLTSKGENIQMNAQQIGSQNTMNIIVNNLSAFPSSASFLQEGDNNRIDFSIIGDISSIGEGLIQINQFGNNQSFSSNLDASSASPLEVTQTPGIGGEGMQVNITTYPSPSQIGGN